MYNDASGLWRRDKAAFSVGKQERFRFIFFDQTLQSSLFGTDNNSTLPFLICQCRALCSERQRFFLYFFAVTTQSPVCYNITMFAVGMGHGSVVSFSIYQCRVRCRQEERFNLLHFLCWHGDRFSLVLFDATMQSSLLEWGKVQSCPFRCNKAEFPVRIGNGPVLPFSIWQCSVRCWDGQRFFLSFSI